MQKVAIIGAGRVGETAAQILAEQETAREVVLIDIREDAPQGVALDIAETAPFFEFDTKVTGSNDPAAMHGADVVVVTAGVPRKPGMSRSDVLETNVNVIDGIVDDIVRYAPDAIIIMVTNPVDVLTYRAWRRSGWPRERVLGQAGVLDASRMAAFIAMETGFSAHDITTIVLGGHGDSMVPVPRFCPGPLPVHAVYALGVHEPADVRLEPVETAERFALVGGNTYRSAFLFGLGLSQMHFHAAARLAKAVRFARITRPAAGFRLDELVDRLEEEIGGPVEATQEKEAS